MSRPPHGRAEVLKLIRDLTAVEDVMLRPVDWQSWLKLLGLAAWFVTLVLAVAWDPLIAGLPVFLLMGVFHYHLIVALHETIHRSLFASKALDDGLGVVIGGLELANFDSVKKHHLTHHQQYGFADDPDRNEYVFDPLAKSLPELVARIFWRSFAFTNLGEKIDRNLWRRTPLPADTGNQSQIRNIVVMGAVQLAILGIFTGIGAWWHYLVFWIAPMFVLSRFLSGVRMFGEHAGLGLEAPVSAREQIYRARTTAFEGRSPARVLWWIEKLLFAPFNFNYHHEHHIMPHLPHHHLPRVHRALLRAGYYEAHPQVKSRSFVDTMREQARLAAAAGPPEAVEART